MRAPRTARPEAPLRRMRAYVAFSVVFLLVMWFLGALLLYQLPNDSFAREIAITGIVGGTVIFFAGLVGGTSLRFRAIMKIGQIAFWVAVAIAYGIFSFHHARQIGSHLAPIPEFNEPSCIYGAGDDGEGIGVWEPVADAIVATNTRISELNNSNDSTNKAAAISYGFAAAIALACAYFTYRESRPS